ncbi:hypothetical protein MKX01_009620 [Papaver californicum]|nr:hypothetical protein MKX01_036624 [Papaver californicum]KAI3983661.1 hypothetical protein MKX01_009620 [Papaver californicum]
MEEERTDDGRGEDHATLKPRISSILYLTLIASDGGLVFGYYVGFIIARFGVRTYDNSILHVSSRSILIADTLICIGAILLVLLLFIGDCGLFSIYFLQTIGNMFIALGVGMASMTSPLYISELSPPKLRDILVSINFVFYGVGKLTFLCLNNDPIRITNYIIALAGIPALFQFRLMKPFPESPMWLYKKDREDDAIKVLKKMYTCCEVGKEFDAFRLLIRSETSDEDGLSYSGSSIFCKIRSAWSNSLVRKQFVVDTCLQAAQQLVGINALIYCIPIIHRMIGFGPSDPKDDIPFMKTSLMASFGLLSILCGICCTFCLMVRFGKKLLSWSIYCVLAVLLGLSFILIVSPNTTEVNNTCSSYLTAPCFPASSGCGFCRSIHNDILSQSSGACLIAESSGTSEACYIVFPLPTTFIFSILMFSGSLEIIPWIINSQMYPTEVRGIYGGTAAGANWTFFLTVIIFSFFLTKSRGPLFICLLISLLSFFVSMLIKSFVPENIGFLISTRKRK